MNALNTLEFAINIKKVLFRQIMFRIDNETGLQSGFNILGNINDRFLSDGDGCDRFDGKAILLRFDSLKSERSFANDRKSMVGVLHTYKGLGSPLTAEEYPEVEAYVDLSLTELTFLTTVTRSVENWSELLIRITVDGIANSEDVNVFNKRMRLRDLKVDKDYFYSISSLNVFRSA